MRGGATTTRSSPTRFRGKGAPLALHACADVLELLAEGTGARWGSDAQTVLGKTCEMGTRTRGAMQSCRSRLDRNRRGWPARQWPAVRHPEVPVDLCLVFRVGGHGRSQELQQRHRQMHSCMQRRGFLDHPRNDTLSFCRCPAVLTNHPTSVQVIQARAVAHPWLHLHVTMCMVTTTQRY